MSIDLKNAENRIKKYLKAVVLEQNGKNEKNKLFSLAVSRSIRVSNNDLLKSNELRLPSRVGRGRWSLW